MSSWQTSRIRTIILLLSESTTLSQKSAESTTFISSEVTKPKEPVRCLKNDVNFHIATMTMQYITRRTSVYLMEKTCKKHQVFVSRLNLVHGVNIWFSISRLADCNNFYTYSNRAKKWLFATETNKVQWWHHQPAHHVLTSFVHRYNDNFLWRTSL